MIRTIWMCLSAPFISIYKGKYLGHKASRNPFSWVGLFVMGLLLIPFAIIVYPILMVWTYLGFNKISKYGLSGSFENNSLVLRSNERGLEAEYKIEEIKCVQLKFNPPLTYPVLVLNSGEQVELKMANTSELFQECKRHGVKVNEVRSMDV